MANATLRKQWLSKKLTDSLETTGRLIIIIMRRVSPKRRKVKEIDDLSYCFGNCAWHASTCFTRFPILNNVYGDVRVTMRTFN